MATTRAERMIAPGLIITSVTYDNDHVRNIMMIRLIGKAVEYKSL